MTEENAFFNMDAVCNFLHIKQIIKIDLEKVLHN